MDISNQRKTVLIANSDIYIRYLQVHVKMAPARTYSYTIASGYARPAVID